jgi:hypothetical protein
MMAPEKAVIKAKTQMRPRREWFDDGECGVVVVCLFLADR